MSETLRSLLRNAVSDPGVFVARRTETDDAPAESQTDWQARAVLDVLRRCDVYPMPPTEPVSHDVADWGPCEWLARSEPDECPLHSAHRWRGAHSEGRVDPPHESRDGRPCWCIHGGHEVVDLEGL